MEAVEETRGYTAFGSAPSPTYRFKISPKTNKISIWLENLLSKQQWSTGYLDTSDYMTVTNRIPGATNGDYISVSSLPYKTRGKTRNRLTPMSLLTAFEGTLRYLMDKENLKNAGDAGKIGRRLTEQEGGAVQLKLSVNLRALGSAWLAQYVFLLKPVSLDRIDIVEAQLRDAEDQVTKTKTKLRGVEEQVAIAEAKLRRMEEKLAEGPETAAQLYVVSTNVKKLNDEGLIVWDDDKLERFQFTGDRGGIRILVPGWYILNLTVHLRPQSNWGTVNLRKNNYRIQCSQVPSGAKVNTSASFGRTIHLDKGDTIDVILTKSPTHVGANMSLTKFAD